MSRDSSRANHNAFRWSIILNASLSGLQIVVGVTFGSIALIGDAIHNFGDVIGLLMGWGAETLGHRHQPVDLAMGLAVLLKSRQ